MNGVPSNPPVTFSYETWVTMFPEMAPLSASQGAAYFAQACLVCWNSITNPIFCTGNLATLLYLLTSHVAWLNCPKDANGNPAATGTPAAQLVGRINQASEGSVSVSLELNVGSSANAQLAYFSQTKYGLSYWTFTAQFRTARYVARPTIVVNGIFPALWSGTGPYFAPGV
jgi:Protein of unknown function (DUF4054)